MKRQQLSATDESKTQAPQVNSLQQVITRHSSFLSSAPHTRSPHTRSAAEARGGRDGTVVGEAQDVWEKAQDGVAPNSASFSQDGLRMAPGDTALARAAHSDAADIVLRRNSDRLHARRSPTDRSLPVPLARNTLVSRRSPHRAALPRTAVLVSRRSPHVYVAPVLAHEKGLVAVLTPSPTPAQAAAQGGKAKSQSNGTPKSRSKKQKTARDLEREAADATDHELLEAPTHLFRCSVRHTQSSLESTRGPTV